MTRIVKAAVLLALLAAAGPPTGAALQRCVDPQTNCTPSSAATQRCVDPQGGCTPPS